MTVAAPKCKLCGSAHWSWEPHVWGEAVSPEKLDAAVVEKTPTPKKSKQHTATKRPVVPPKKAAEIESAMARLAELRDKERDKKRRYRAKKKGG